MLEDLFSHQLMLSCVLYSILNYTSIFLLKEKEIAPDTDSAYNLHEISMFF